MNITPQEAEWLKKELEIMVDESDSGKVPRSKFSKNVMISLLAKLRELDK